MAEARAHRKQRARTIELAAPQFVRGKLCALDQRLELGPHDRWMHATVQRALGKAAVATGNDILTPDQPRETDNTLRDQFGGFDNVCSVTDTPRNKRASFRQFPRFPAPPFMLVARIGTFDRVAADIY